MGKYDEVLGKYFSDNNRYADLINGFVLNGKQIIKPEDLSAMDSRIHGQKKNARSKYRDLIRRIAFGANFAIIGVENQDEVNYCMPVRSMGYDVREYERQISKRRKELVDMLDLSEIPAELCEYVNNYPIHILDVKKLENTQVFQTDLKQVFEFIIHSKDKHKLRELSRKDSSYLEMDEDAYEVAVAFTGAEELLAVKKKEGGDMCQALKELLQDEREEGREEGREEVTLRLTSLIQKLLYTGRSEDLLKATKDKEYLQQLCTEYGI